HQMLLPLMATAVVAHGVARSVAPVPLYHALSHPWLRRAQKRAHEKRPFPAPPVEGAQGAGAAKPASEG
ncbi:MAG: chloride channel protein, partial [Thauera sp.]|nr:chloride channel protein [Thauera sp.]